MPTPVALNFVPTTLSVEPINVKSVVPAVTILYSFPVINAPLTIGTCVKLQFQVGTTAGETIVYV